MIINLTGLMTASQEVLPDRVEKLKAENQDYKYKLAAAKQKLMEVKIAEIPAEQENVLLFEQDLENLVMRNAVNELTERHAGLCGIFVGTEESGYQFIIGSKNVDCTQTAALLRGKVKAKCGGSKQMIQGSVQAGEAEIRELFA